MLQLIKQVEFLKKQGFILGEYVKNKDEKDSYIIKASVYQNVPLLPLRFGGKRS